VGFIPSLAIPGHAGYFFKLPSSRWSAAAPSVRDRAGRAGAQGACLKIVIVGAGEVGFNIAKRLASENKDVLIIDANPDALKRIGEHLDVKTLEGSGSSPKVLEEAGVADADLLLAVTNSDEANLIACFFANHLAPKTRKVVRLRNEDYTAYSHVLVRDILNVSMVINPDVEVVHSILRLISAPGALELNEFADGRIVMAGVRLAAASPLTGLKLMNLPAVTGSLRLVIAALVREERLIIPKGPDRFEAGDLVYFACEKKDLDAALRTLGADAKPVKNVLIVGGGKIGLLLAQELERRKYAVKLVEINPDRGEDLSALLDKSIVLLGDGTDHELLEEENIKSMDMVVALTGDEETNIISCLLAKRLGARQTITRVNKFAYMPLVKAIGVDHIVSPRLSAINSILHHIRRGKIISAVSIQDEEAEILEAIALPNSDLVGKPLKDLEVRKHALILCILRADEVIIPTGDSVVRPEDRILALAARKDVPKVEKALAVRVERY